ncbi:MAG: OmpH family outer membrane protein [Muribaculaceae bacterium]|nr:OmpH family outer membrane protein [Muribaculaceae bacterium]
MFKKIFLAIALILPMTAMAQKFGVVDVDSIFTAMPEYTQMQTQLEQTSNQYQEEFNRLQEEVTRLITEYQAMAEDANTPQSIKERRIQEIQERDQRIQQFRNTAQQDIARQQEQLAAPIQQRLTDAIKSVGLEGGYTFILPNEPSLLLYIGTDVTNVTSAVRAKLGL